MSHPSAVDLFGKGLAFDYHHVIYKPPKFPKWPTPEVTDVGIDRNFPEMVGQWQVRTAVQTTTTANSDSPYSVKETSGGANMGVVTISPDGKYIWKSVVGVTKVQLVRARSNLRVPGSIVWKLKDGTRDAYLSWDKTKNKIDFGTIYWIAVRPHRRESLFREGFPLRVNRAR